MGKSKPKRSLSNVGRSQHITEQSSKDKFAQTEDLVKNRQQKQTAPGGRISPQLSCTVAPEDKELLNQLTLFASNKVGKVLNPSIIIRALIRFGYDHKEKLEF